METGEVGLAYVIGYNPDNATIDIRTIDGTVYSALPFDANLAFYSTPVLPILRTEPSTGAVRTIKLGSCALFTKFSDNNIRIVRIFNDDQDLIKNFPGRANQPIHAYVRDTLVASLQDGEALMSAPGRIIETTVGVYERQVGSWLLCKNSGDAILSNADSSCEVFVSYSGQFEVNSTKYRMIGVDTKIQEDDAGTLWLTSGASRGSPVSLSLSKDAVAQLASGTSLMTMTPSDYTISSGVVNITGGNEVNVDTATLNMSASTLNVAAENLDVAVSAGLTAAAYDLAVRAYNTAAVSADKSITVSAPKNNILIDATGTKITIDPEAKLTIVIGETSIEVSKDGITLLPPSGKIVSVGANASKQVLIEGTAAQALVPVYSTVLKVAS